MYKHKEYTDETIIAVLREAKTGSYLPELSKKYSISQAVIAGWCKRANVTYKRKNRLTRDWEKIKLAL